MVSEFLAEEKKMLAWMEGEKRKYLNAPERHEHYTSEWNYFYEKKCQEERVKVHPSMIRDEWNYRWEGFIGKEFGLKIEDEGIRLLRKYGINMNDVRESIKRKEEKAKAEPKKPEQPEVTVLNTLRILSAMETLLGQEQGYKTNILLAQAKSLEAKHGSQAASSQLLQRQDFVDFAHTSKEILSGKLISGAVTNENQIRGVRTCIENIEALLQTPNCLKPTVKPILNLEKYQDPLKVRIAETIINHFKELAPNGEDISQSHLDNLVLSEFNRIQEDAQQQQQQLQGRHQEASSARSGAWGYDNAPSRDYAGHYQTTVPPSPPPAGNPQSTDASTSSINWDAIQHAVKTVVTSPSAPSAPNSAAPLPSSSPSPSLEDSGPTLEEKQDMAFHSEVSGSSALEQRENIITPKLEPNLVGANPPPTKVSAGVTESVDEPENSSAAKTRETDEDDGWEDLSIDDLASLFLNFKTLDKDTSTQLLAYMKRLEKSDPDKLNRFKQHMQSVKNNR